MRLFEALSIAIIVCFVLASLFPRLRRWQDGIAAALVVVLVVHLLVEGLRWQMSGVYALSVLIVIAQIARRFRSGQAEERNRPGVITYLGAGLAALILIVSGLALSLLPVPRFPKPGGPYPVGMLTLHWVDESRLGVYTPTPDAPRELMVQILYPAEPGPGRGEPWLDSPSATIPLLAQWGDLPTFMLNHLNLVRTHSVNGLAVAGTEASYPVIIYVHGWGGTRNINQDQLEMLASHGYIVVSADHTYGALVTTFPDGRVVPYNPDALPDDVPEDVHNQDGQALIDTYAGDVGFMLDQLAALSADAPASSPLSRLDLTRVGLMGHSTGGGAIVEFCATDARCKALFGQDAWVSPLSDQIVSRGLTQPVVLMNSELWSSDANKQKEQQIIAGAQGPATWLEIAGTDHYDFVIVPLFSPLAASLGLKGPLPADRVIAINHAYLLAFFDMALKGQPTTLFDSPAPDFPEVSFLSAVP